MQEQNLLIWQDYTRSAEEDEDFGITHLRAHALSNDAGSGRLATVGEDGEKTGVEDGAIEDANGKCCAHR